MIVWFTLLVIMQYRFVLFQLMKNIILPIIYMYIKENCLHEELTCQRTFKNYDFEEVHIYK